MPIATVAQLMAEMVGLVKTSASIDTRGFSVFNTEDLENISGNIGFPLAGISYEGASKQENSVQGQRGIKSASFVTLHFMLTVGVTYQYASGADSKPVATDLLDEIRNIVLGYSGVNSRPWVFVGETPLDTDLEGVIFYGQMWETNIPVLGNSPT